MKPEMDAEIENAASAPPWPQELPPEVVGPADYSRREFALREWMDGPSTYADYCAGALDLERVNQWTFGYKPTLDFMERVVAKTGVDHEPLHVLDVGCGHGDGLRKIYQWAAKRSVPLRLTGVDLNPYAGRLARESDRAQHVPVGAITWITGDAFETRLEHPPDVIVSSLFAHHLPDELIVRLLRWKAENARVAWMVSDLRRSERAANGFKWLARLLRWDDMVKHDGAMSFRRALTIDDWTAKVHESAITAKVTDVGIGRVVVEGTAHKPATNNHA